MSYPNADLARELAEPMVEPAEPVIPTDEQMIAAARHQYANDDVQIDDNAIVSRGDEPGAFVAAWVWVRFEGCGRPA